MEWMRRYVMQRMCENREGIDKSKGKFTPFDADGTISPSQVTRKCKKLGLKLPSRKSVTEEGTTDAEISLPDTDNPDGLLKKPSHSRRRVRAIDENLLLKIRNLYEQFKDHQRCSHMIAKELDPNGTMTAARVSRELKKLGLHTLRMRADTKKQKMDETDASTDGEDDLDDLPLSLLKKRSKTSEVAVGRSNANQSPALSSDDDLVLSSISKDDMEQAETMDTSTKHSEHQSVSDRGRSSTPQKYNGSTHSGSKTSDLNLDSASENDAVDSRSRKRKGLSLNESADPPLNENHYNELEDSEDEQQPSASPKSVTRRNLRVVLDFDDDE